MSGPQQCGGGDAQGPGAMQGWLKRLVYGGAPLGIRYINNSGKEF